MVFAPVWPETPPLGQEGSLAKLIRALFDGHPKGHYRGKKVKDDKWHWFFLGKMFPLLCAEKILYMTAVKTCKDELISRAKWFLKRKWLALEKCSRKWKWCQLAMTDILLILLQVSKNLLEFLAFLNFHTAAKFTIQKSHF